MAATAWKTSTCITAEKTGNVYDFNTAEKLNQLLIKLLLATGQLAEGGEYTYRCILTNDWDMTDEEIIQHYNKRGTAEQVFDRQNNDFGWAHLPKSFMNQNTVFLLITAMAANFYLSLLTLRGKGELAYVRSDYALVWQKKQTGMSQMTAKIDH